MKNLSPMATEESQLIIVKSDYWHNDEISTNDNSFRFTNTDAGRSNSQRPKQKNDCTVRALAIVLNMGYDDAFDMLKRFGRKSNRGIKFSDYAATQSTLYKRTMFPAVKDKKRMTVSDFCAAYTTGRYIIKTAKHVLCVIDGEVFDNCKPPSQRCVYSAYQVSLDIVDV